MSPSAARSAGPEYAIAQILCFIFMLLHMFEEGTCRHGIMVFSETIEVCRPTVLV